MYTHLLKSVHHASVTAYRSKNVEHERSVFDRLIFSAWMERYARIDQEAIPGRRSYRAPSTGSEFHLSKVNTCTSTLHRLTSTIACYFFHKQRLITLLSLSSTLDSEDLQLYANNWSHLTARIISSPNHKSAWNELFVVTSAITSEPKREGAERNLSNLAKKRTDDGIRTIRGTLYQ